MSTKNKQEDHPTTDYSGANIHIQTRLCDLCANFNRADLVSKGNRNIGYKHHSTYNELRAAAQGSCELCYLLHWTFLCHGFRIHREAIENRVPKPWSLEEFVQHHERLDAETNMPFCISFPVAILLDVNGSNQSEMINGLTYARQGMDGESEWNARSWLLVSPIGGVTGNIAGRQLKDFWDVDLCSQWLTQCSEQHQRCKHDVETRLPTRLIQLADEASDGHVKLVETTNISGRYVTLSYCWGSSRPVSTT